MTEAETLLAAADAYAKAAYTVEAFAHAFRGPARQALLEAIEHALMGAYADGRADEAQERRGPL